jgi:hypothetical protein
MKYWSRLLGKDETNPLGKTMNSKKRRGKQMDEQNYKEIGKAREAQ